MIDDEHMVAERSPAATLSPRRISWAAVFAGVVIVLVVQLTLSLLGMGIGTSTINPLSEQNPVAGLGTGSAIWLAISTLIALYAGGLVAGRLAGMPRKVDGALHGVLTWGLATLATFYLLSSTLSSIVGGTASLVGSGVSQFGQGISKVAPKITDLVQDQLAARGIDLTSIKDEAAQILRQTGKPNLQPENLASDAKATTEAARGGISDAAKAPARALDEISAVIDRVLNKGQANLEEADKEALINVLVARTDMSKEEAAATVDRWHQTALTAKAKIDEAKNMAGQKLREASDIAAQGVSRAALWSSLALIVGAIAAAAGGGQGTKVGPVQIDTGSRHRESRSQLDASGTSKSA